MYVVSIMQYVLSSCGQSTIVCSHSFVEPLRFNIDGHKTIKMSLIIIYYVEIYKSKWKKTIIENIKKHIE